MAIDTATKRRAALGRSAIMMPLADGTIDENDRAIFLRLYLPFAVVAVTTPLTRINAIARELRRFAVSGG